MMGAYHLVSQRLTPKGASFRGQPLPAGRILPHNSRKKLFSKGFGPINLSATEEKYLGEGPYRSDTANFTGKEEMHTGSQQGEA